MADCVIVVPCYNEAARLKADAFVDYVTSSRDVLFLFVDDGSTDQTIAILRELQSRTTYIQVLVKRVNQGKAEAVRDGLLLALRNPGVSYVGFWDADLATPLSAIDDLLSIITRRLDINAVFGSRIKLLGRSIERHAIRHYLGRVFATCASCVLGIPIYDTQCGAKLFRATADLKCVLSSPFLSKWIFDVELIARFIQLHGDNGSQAQNMIYEFPLYSWADIPGSKLRATDFLRSFRDLLFIRKRYLRGGVPRSIAHAANRADCASDS